MNPERVIGKILSDAKAEAEKIATAAKEKRSGEQEKLEKELVGYRHQTDRLARNAAENRKMLLLAAARMDLKKQQLATKRKLLDEVFAAAAQRLRGLDDNEYRELMSKLLLKAVQTGDEEVIIGKNETRIDQAFITNINRRLGPGYKGNLRLSQQRDNLDGGFILKRGKIKTNVSIEVLLAQAREKLQIELAKELFAG